MTASAGDDPKPPVLPEVRWRRAARTGIVTVCVLLGAILFGAFDPASHGFFPRCQFHQLTGLDCPGCGGQRAAHQLLHGHVAAAFRCNALFVSLLPVGVWYAMRFIFHRIHGHLLPSPFQHRLWLWLLTGLIVGFGIVRNLPGCEFLRP